MTRALIADDEPALLAHLESALASAWPELEIVATAANGREALEAARAHKPEIAFLDIRMPGLSGLDVAAQLPADLRVVFVTAYDEYAVDAFEAAAADYLLKPVTAERLQQTVQRLKGAPSIDQAALSQLISQLADPDPPTLTWLRAGYGDTTQLVAVDDVIYFEADHKYTNVITRDRTYVLRTPIKALEEQLDGSQFWRVHRSTIVNVSAIEEAKRDLRGRYVLKLRGRKETVRTSQAYGHLFKQM